jgi:hypothetical protein
MKPTKVRAWPELSSFAPALPSLTDGRRATVGTAAPIELDLGSVREVTSTGLTVFLLQLLRLIGRERRLDIRPEGDPGVLSELTRLGAFRLLSSMAGSVQPDLYQVELPATTTAGSALSLPVHRLKFSGASNPRDIVRDFVNWLILTLPTVVGKDYTNSNGLIILLKEIAKNSADHAGQDALFGLDLTDVGPHERRLRFVFGDLGVGIKQHIEAHLPFEEAKRKRHMSLYEAYRLALKPGYTSNRDSGLNQGHGMSIIVNATSDLGISLSVFDAWSRGVLSQIANVHWPSHNAVRRSFHIVGHDVGFFYHGDLILKST